MRLRSLLLALLLSASLPASAAWEDAVNAYNKGDFATAAREFRPFAENGQAMAQYLMGWFHQAGEGVAQDYAESARWYTRAAERGNADAQQALGSYYLSGTGVPRNDLKAAEWLRKSAEQGRPGAQYLLGYVLARGEGGVRRDEAEAASWTRKAADQGYADAQYALALALLSGSGVTRDEPEANQWLRKAAEQKHLDSAYLLAWNLEKAVGTTPDYTEAARWYRSAAEAGHAESQFQLATLLRDGRGVSRDDTAAMDYFRKAAAAGLAQVPGAIDDYMKAGRHDRAFALADAWLQKNPEDVALLLSLGLTAATEGRSDPVRFAQAARSYGERAIALIEADRRPSGLDDAQWAEYRTRWLPMMHLRLGLLAQKTGQAEAARERFRKVTALSPKDPYGWIYLGQTHFSDYQRTMESSRGLDGAAKNAAVGRAYAQLDGVIECYARALGLPPGEAGFDAMRDTVLRDLRSYYEFRNGSRAGLDELLARFRQ